MTLSEHSDPQLIASAARQRDTTPLRILVLHQHYWPEIAATAQLLTDLCEDLASYGHQVEVVCGQPSYRRVDGATKLPATEQHHGVQIHRVWSHLPQERTIARRLAQYGTYFASSLTASLLSRKPDVCFVMSTPPLLLGLSGSLLRAVRDVPFVYSVQDLYPDIAVHLGVLKAGALSTQAIDTVARTCYRAAASITTLSPGMARRLADKGVPESRIHVIPNWSAASSVARLPRDNPFAREHQLCDRFVVQYSGNLGLSQGLEHVLEAAQLLRELPVTLALIGDGNAREGLQKRASELKLDNVRFLPPQPRELLPELLASCEVGLVTMKRAVGDDLVPSKLYGILAAGRPVIAAVESSSEVARVVNQHRCGWVVEPESAQALAQGIRAALEASERDRAARGDAGHRACEQEYSRAALTRRYEHILSSAAGRSPSALRRSVALTAQG